MSRIDLIIYALEILEGRDRLDISRYENIISLGHAKPQDYEWYAFHRKRLAKTINLIGELRNKKNETTSN